MRSRPGTQADEAGFEHEEAEAGALESAEAGIACPDVEPEIFRSHDPSAPSPFKEWQQRYLVPIAIVHFVTAY
jgi:hypothetical protein